MANKKSTTKKSKAEKEAETEALEAELEPRYTIERFYNLRIMHESYCVLLLGFNLFSFHFLPAARYETSVCCTLWSTSFVLSKYFSRYRGTEHQEYGKKLFNMAFEGLFVLHEIFQARNSALATEEGRNGHVAMVILTKYFLGLMIYQISGIPRSKDIPWAQFVIFPAIVWQKPRFGIFQPHYEALAFLLAFSLGCLIGSVIDEMSWRHHVQMHKKELEIDRKTRELSKESRKREMAMEVLESYNDKSSFFEIRKPAT